jgi:hypothetical protein
MFRDLRRGALGDRRRVRKGFDGVGDIAATKALEALRLSCERRGEFLRC